MKYVDVKDDDWFKPLYESTIAAIDINGKANAVNGELIFNLWLLRTLCSKKQRWSNECEWRAIGNGNQSCLGPLISCVIVGHKISKIDFDEILSYSKQKGYHLKITDIDYDKKEVIVRDLTEKDIKIIERN